ncbi:MAG TPA: hypothetical protein VJ954_08060 [Ignavibacteriaceae bacterium]|nr:hypothetical protein [Ignavibacteriaceae bacterium]
MKKKKYKLIPLPLFILILLFAGCETSVKNSFKVTNDAAADIVVTFRAQTISVASGQTKEIKEIPQGTYSYSTFFTVPPSATSYSSSGDVTGQVVIKAST